MFACIVGWCFMKVMNFSSTALNNHHLGMEKRHISCFLRLLVVVGFKSLIPTIMGGSQLKQLKAAISTSGVSNSQGNSRKRKRGDGQGTTRGAVLEHRDKRAEKLREIHEKFNAFDIKVEKVKHEVGGRKIKGTMGKPGASKQAGLEQVSISPARYVYSDT